jgi:hypothetical protein
MKKTKMLKEKNAKRVKCSKNNRPKDPNTKRLKDKIIKDRSCHFFSHGVIKGRSKYEKGIGQIST